ncbi:MAG: DUF916 domain-containing protein [Microbacteriaceae bacterium]|nr:DUF916 domain-containing protein [Microbacteriaceae bacterium]
MLRTPAAISGFVALAFALAPLALAVPSASASPPVAAAGADITWSIAPSPTAKGARSLFDYSVGPGTQIVDSVDVTNSSSVAAEFLIYATDAINEQATGAFSLLKRDVKPTDLGSWVTTKSDRVTIQPKTKATIPFNLLIPSDATPGDHVAGIVASVLSAGTSKGSTVTLEQRVGTRMYLTVSGERVPGVRVAGVTSGFTSSFNPFAPGDMTVGYDVRNSGNTRIDVTNTVSIAGPFGIPLGTFEPKPLSNLLPRQTVHYKARVPGVIALLLAWSTVTVSPGDIGTAGKKPSSQGPSATPSEPAGANSAVSVTPAAAGGVTKAGGYAPVSSTVMTAAISWVSVALVLLVLAAAFLIWRYVTGTRERFYRAIDEAFVSAREEALGVSAAQVAK